MDNDFTHIDSLILSINSSISILNRMLKIISLEESVIIKETLDQLHSDLAKALEIKSSISSEEIDICKKIRVLDDLSLNRDRELDAIRLSDVLRELIVGNNEAADDASLDLISIFDIASSRFSRDKFLSEAQEFILDVEHEVRLNPSRRKLDFFNSQMLDEFVNFLILYSIIDKKEA